MIAGSTAKLAQANKVRGLAGGHSPVLQSVPECLKGEELFEFIARGTQIWHSTPHSGSHSVLDKLRCSSSAQSKEQGQKCW